MTSRRFLRARILGFCKRARRTPKPETGDTLVEVLLALIVLGLASVALIIAFGTTFSASATHRNLTNADVALASADANVSTLVQGSVKPLFGTCANDNPASYPSVSAISANLPATYSAQITSIQYWNGTGWTSTCSASVYNAPQLITIQVTSTAAKTTFETDVVVDNPTTVANGAGSGGTAYQLAFTVEPNGATFNTAFTTQPEVQVQTSTGVQVSSDLSYITISIVPGTGASGATLSCPSTIESSGTVYYNGCSISEIGTGYQLTATETLSNGTVLVPAVSVPFNVSATQLDTPTVAPPTPSTTEAGAVNVTFTGSDNAPTSGQSYTAKACTDSAMSVGCVTQANFTSGSDLIDLIAGNSYYVQIEAMPSTDYLPATTPASGPALATVQLLPPGTPTVGYGSVAGSVNTSFSPSSNAPTSGQSYTAKACTNTLMTIGCVSNTSFSSGSDLTSLAYVAGSPGSKYYVEVLANASSGYLASAYSAPSLQQADTSQMGAPGTPTVTPSTTTAGVVTVSFAGSSGTAPASYTVRACTDSGMTANCVSQTGFTSGSLMTGLVPGNTYYFQITAITPSSAYVSNTSSISSAAFAPVQLATPSTPVLAYGSVAGSINVTSTSSNAPASQTYTVKACTDAGMSLNCVTNTTFTSGSDLTGLTYVTGSAGGTYYVEVLANASAGYLVSGYSGQSSHADTSKIGAPGTPTATPSATTAGALTVTFASSTGVAPASYTVKACTDAAMTLNCVSQTGYTSGSQFTGLTGGAAYYVQVTAIAPSTAYVAQSSPVTASTTKATAQLTAPAITTVAPSTTTAGALTVAYSGSSNAPAGQSYTVKACTDAAMTLNCVSQTGYASGAQFTTLTPGTAYYVQVTAIASSGYIAQSSAVTANPTKATVKLNTQPAPTVTGTGFGNNKGLRINFSASSNAPAGQTYTVRACTDIAMTLNCVQNTNFTSGSTLTIGNTNTPYYVTVWANASTGYLQSATSPDSTPTAP